jgi:hypothetical protein
MSIKHNNRIVDVIKLLRLWRDTFEEKIAGEDYYYTHIHKDRDEGRLLENLQADANDTIDNLIEYKEIPSDSDIYED